MGKSIFMKLFICTVFIIVISSSFCLPVSHASSLGEVFSEGKEFLNSGQPIKNTLNTTELENTSKYIYNTLLGIAIMVAIIVAMVLGIQFMAASADEKAKVKEAILPFVVGCIVVFGAFTIWKIAVNIGNNAESKIAQDADEKLQEVRQEKSDLLARVHNGEIDDFTDEEVKRAYTTNYIDTDLHDKTTQDPRAGR